MSTFNLLEAAIAAGAAPVRQLLERDGAGLHLRAPAVRAGLPADRRGASRPAAGLVRDREVVRRAADGAGARARGHRDDLDPALLGAGRGELRAQPRPDRPRPVGARSGTSARYVDVYDLCEATRSRSSPTSRVTRSSTWPRRTRSAAIRSRRSCGATTAATQVELRPLAAAGRLRDRLLEGAAAARLGADAHLAGLPRRRRQAEGGGDGAVVTRRLGRAGPEITTARLRHLGAGGPRTGSAGERSTTRSRSQRSAARSRPASTGSTPRRPTAIGHSEEVVGRALEPFRAGEEVLVFTKCGRPWRGGEVYFDLRPESIRQECEASLRRLGVERIDLYQFHWPDYATGTPVEESWGTMVELVDEGKVRWLGVCNFDVARLEAVRGDQARRLAPAAALAPQPARPPGADPVGSRARHRRDRLLADGVRACSPARSTAKGSTGSPRTTGAARARRSRSRSCSRNLALVEPVGAARRRASASRFRRPRGRMGARGAGRDGRDRRRAPPCRSSTIGSGRTTCELDEQTAGRDRVRSSRRRAPAPTRRRSRRPVA